MPKWVPIRKTAATIRLSINKLLPGSSSPACRVAVVSLCT
jgi:hypothetical protein